MAAARDSHTATVLPDGRVLVVGGPGAEIYDPSANHWSAAGTPLMARTSATATLLAGGRVLVAAGIVGEFSVPKTEIYDPRTNAWAAAASLAGRRYDHTATLLADGRVLVVGGTRSTVTLDSAELYDPKTDAWSPAASLPAPRTHHTAALLPDGRVLVAGGINGQPLATTAIFDPTANRWTAGESMGVPRRGALATRLRDGRIMVVGGLEFPGPAEAAAEIFNPTTGTWAAAGQSTQPLLRDGIALSLLKDGRVLVSGGMGSGDLGPGSTAGYVYDPQRDQWSATADMRQGRVDHTASLLPNGRVLVAGGRDAYTNGTPLSSTEIFDVSAVSSQPSASAVTSPAAASAAPSPATNRFPVQLAASLLAAGLFAGGVLLLVVVLVATTVRRLGRRRRPVAAPLSRVSKESGPAGPTEE
jgi:Kelch motif/Galactose oxidase, central domain